jgi:GLPGLI family protein
MCFKKNKYIFTGTFLFFFLSLFAQKEFQGVAYYQSKTTVDMSNFGGGQLSEERKKQIQDRMKNALEKTFILTFNQSESLYKEEERLETPGQGSGGRFRMMNASGGDQYKNVKTQELFQSNDLLGKQFLIKDSLQSLDWKLTGETRKIGKYTCFKAIALKAKTGFDFSSFGRRSSSEKPRDSTKTDSTDIKEIEPKEVAKEIIITAWYTPQIPINQGPDIYWGLPGLILEINADRTTILCSKIVLNPVEKEKIKAPSKGKEVTQAEYDDIMKAKMEEMREMFRSRRGGGRR